MRRMTNILLKLVVIADSGSMKDRDANASVSKLNEYHEISCSDNLSASKKCEVNNFSGDENSASCSNVSDVSSLQIKACDDDNADVVEERHQCFIPKMILQSV